MTKCIQAMDHDRMGRRKVLLFHHIHGWVDAVRDNTRLAGEQCGVMDLMPCF